MKIHGKIERSTNAIGEISEAAIITRFLQLGYRVFIPYGRNQRYDLVIEGSNGQFLRVQCKTARIARGGAVIKFDTANHNYALKNKRWRHYREQCDYFAVFCEQFNKVYFIPVTQVGITEASLRLAETKNCQEKFIRWAKSYEL